ncbi:MAG: hypothetical protein L6V95_13560 [Candidatus Melainabacteria bacterium]|nr:MAG: hypothetical protein L6V95_13560 [Candidatus Melainabacteria bacterium]
MHSYIVGEFTDMGEFNPGEDTKEGYNGDENSKYPTGDIAEMEIRKNSNMTSCANFNYTWSLQEFFYRIQQMAICKVIMVQIGCLEDLLLKDG